MTPRRSPRAPRDESFPPPLPRTFYDRPAEVVARDLLGKQLVRVDEQGVVRGRIVEVEAYLSAEDPACHAARGKSRKNASMFGVPGLAYVYAIHAKWCFNVVTEPEHVPSAVLVRAVEPLAGRDLIRVRRGAVPERDWTRGPARLCQAFAIDRRLDGWDLVRGETLWIAEDDEVRAPRPVGRSPRIGVTSAHELPLRFFFRDSPYASGSRRLNSDAADA